MSCVFNYEFKDLSIHSITSQSREAENDNNVNENTEETCCGENYQNEQRFDLILSKLWDEAQENGLFRYRFQKLPCKVLPGQYQFFAQLNPDRAEKRREPQLIQSLQQPFNEAEFNFRRVRAEEILLQLKSWWSPKSTSSALKTLTVTTDSDSASVAPESDRKKIPHDQLLSDESDHKILINVSPLEYGNVLLVPFIKANQPQVITQEGLRLAVELMLISRSRDFRVGFNSLCAFASVNHFHFHAYYLEHRLYLEQAELKELSGPCLEICKYPAPGFVFALTDLKDESTLDTFVADAYKLILFFQQHNLPHNLVLMRGSTPSCLPCAEQQPEALRLYLWVRSPSLGHKICDAFNPALCELSGHFPIKNETAYATITEDYAAEELRKITADVFASIRDQVATLYS